MTENSPIPQSEIMERMFQIREERKAISERDSELYQEYRELEAQLLSRCDNEGTTKVSSRLGTASVTETVLPQVVDWDALFQHIQETGDFHLLQRRVASAAYRELTEAGVDVPGLTPFVQRSISLRSS